MEDAHVPQQPAGFKEQDEMELRRLFTQAVSKITQQKQSMKSLTAINNAQCITIEQLMQQLRQLKTDGVLATEIQPLKVSGEGSTPILTQDQAARSPTPADVVEGGTLQENHFTAASKGGRTSQTAKDHKQGATSLSLTGCSHIGCGHNSPTLDRKKAVALCTDMYVKGLNKKGCVVEVSEVYQVKSNILTFSNNIFLTGRVRRNISNPYI
jgi:hypothetical protein